MATFAVGDIHGNCAALDDLLEQLRSEVTGDDVLVFLGDYIDRGPNSKQCVDTLIALGDELPAEVIYLAGNHEDWFLQTVYDYRRHSWLLAMDAWQTIRSYSVDAEMVLREAMANAKSEVYTSRCALPYEHFFNCVPDSHIQFIENLQSHHLSPDCLCSHAGVDPKVAGVQQKRSAFIWGAAGFPERYDGAETVVYGHLDNAVLDAEGWPRPAMDGRTIGIDTIAHGVLTAIRLPDQRIFQSRRYDA